MRADSAGGTGTRTESWGGWTGMARGGAARAQWEWEWESGDDAVHGENVVMSVLESLGGTTQL